MQCELHMWGIRHPEFGREITADDQIYQGRNCVEGKGRRANSYAIDLWNNNFIAVDNLKYL